MPYCCLARSTTCVPTNSRGVLRGCEPLCRDVLHCKLYRRGLVTDTDSDWSFMKTAMKTYRKLAHPLMLVPSVSNMTYSPGYFE